MTNWEEYKRTIVKTDSELANDIHEIEFLSPIIGSISAERHFQHLSQKALAEKCNVSASYISKIESGTISPSLTVILRILDSLDLELEVKEKTSY